jgi:hypothetical protein
MTLPSHPVTLTVEQLDVLNKQLSAMRHDVNGFLTVIVAAAELTRLKPESAERWVKTLSEQPHRIKDSVAKFSAEFERTLGISRP